MEKQIKKNKLRGLCSKEKSIFELCDELELNEYEILALVRELRCDGINISAKVHDDALYLFDLGEREYKDEFNYTLTTDENNEFKFVAISDTRFGSKSQQLSILNDIYTKANEMGYKNVVTVFSDDNKKYLSTDLTKDIILKDNNVSSKVELIGYEVI